MARRAREKSPTGVYHIMVRGINKQNIFQEDRDKDKYLELFKRYAKEMGMDVYAYCLMNNHVHLAVKENDNTISSFMHALSSKYVYWYNSEYDRCGPLFQDRFKSKKIEDEYYLKDLIRYIHQNPVKGGLSRDYGDYKWSSYNEYLIKPDIVDTTLLFKFIDYNNFVKYSHEQKEENTYKDGFFEYTSNGKISDIKAADMIKNISGLETVSYIQRLEIKERDGVIRQAKEEGLSIRQIARITGLSKGMVERL